MDFIVTKLNEEGQKLLEIHRQYHASTNTELQKEAFLALAAKYLGNRRSSWSNIFCNPDASALEKFALAQKKFQMDNQSLLPQISEYISAILSEVGINDYEIGIIDPHHTRNQFFLEHRIGLKASDLTRITGGDAANVHNYFKEGHAEATVKMLLFPVASNILSPLAKKNHLDIDYDFESTRKYTYNLRIRFMLKFPNDITKKTILGIGECLKAVDDFRVKNSILF